MRLIDADSIKFIEYVNGDITVNKEAIEKTPTAYDVDKVVKKIADYYDLVPGWALKEIIEIVKSGCIE